MIQCWWVYAFIVFLVLSYDNVLGTLRHQKLRHLFISLILRLSQPENQLYCSGQTLSPMTLSPPCWGLLWRLPLTCTPTYSNNILRMINALYESDFYSSHRMCSLQLFMMWGSRAYIHCITNSTIVDS